MFNVPIPRLGTSKKRVTTKHLKVRAFLERYLDENPGYVTVSRAFYAAVEEGESFSKPMIRELLKGMQEEGLLDIMQEMGTSGYQRYAFKKKEAE